MGGPQCKKGRRGSHLAQDAQGGAGCAQQVGSACACGLAIAWGQRRGGVAQDDGKAQLAREPAETKLIQEFMNYTKDVLCLQV